MLVATTVIEVGVDVPNASLMVIEHAERFGLAQLHQLRGRVGRGAAESTCVLLFEEPLSDRAKARLKVIYENTDGFEIARQDLLIRGPGEFLGARQSGVPLLRFADLERDAALIEQARDAEELLQREPAAAERTSSAGWAAGRSSSRLERAPSQLRVLSYQHSDARTQLGKVHLERRGGPPQRNVLRANGAPSAHREDDHALHLGVVALDGCRAHQRGIVRDARGAAFFSRCRRS